MKRAHYVYLLTRALPEGGCRYYVGIRTCPKRTTPETDTGYLGSGHAIRRAVAKHGTAAFSKSIVETFDSRAEAKALERALVGLTTANSPWSYNLMTGGVDGGLQSEATKAKKSTVKLAQYDNDPEYKARHTAATARANRTASKRELSSTTQKRYWALMTPKERNAEWNRRRRIGQRRTREVGLIFLALVNRYHGAETA